MSEGELTSAQKEILDVVWEAGVAGATIGQIWQNIAETRDVTRTTVANQVERLEQRGWLARNPATEEQRQLDKMQSRICLRERKR